MRLRYLGQDAGVAMNVSYGDSLLHSEVVKGEYVQQMSTASRKHGQRARPNRGI